MSLLANDFIFYGVWTVMAIAILVWTIWFDR